MSICFRETTIYFLLEILIEKLPARTPNGRRPRCLFFFSPSGEADIYIDWPAFDGLGGDTVRRATTYTTDETRA
jgi:hypothetical protein